MNGFSLRQTAAQILAASIFELFPSIEIWSAEATDTGFHCECFFPHPTHPQTLALIEEKMRQIIREKRPIRTLEMVPRSAAALLKKEGHKAQSQALEESEEILVELAEIGSFHSLSSGPHLAHTGCLAAFKLLGMERLPDRGIQVSGAAAESKDALKEFLKKIASHREHRELGERLGLWKVIEEEWVWLDRGLKVRKRLEDLFHSGIPSVSGAEEPAYAELARILPQGFRQIVPSSEPIKDLFESDALVQEFFFPAQENFAEKVISSLHSVGKTLTMLGFNCSVRFVGKRLWKQVEERLLSEGIFPVAREEGSEARLEWVVGDRLDREWVVAAAKPLKGKNSFVCEASVERILALLLEKNLGILPERLVSDSVPIRT